MILSQGRMSLTSVASSWRETWLCESGSQDAIEESHGPGAGVDVGTVTASLSGNRAPGRERALEGHEGETGPHPTGLATLKHVGATQSCARG